MNRKWKPSDADAFMVETKDADYYYALKSALDGMGNHYYKRYRDDRIEEVDQSEIVDIIQNRPDEIIAKCPCVKIIDGRIQPLVSKPIKGSKAIN